MKNLHILLFLAILLANPSFSQIKQARSIVSTLPVKAKNVFNTPQLRSAAQADTTVIWCEDFANGLAGNNDSNSPWTTSGTDGVLWLHDLDGPSGQFSANIEPLTSATANNGWMIFDSDLSNPGSVQAQFVTRRGQLISPYINLSGEENVSLRFDHSYRWCCDNDHELLVGVSNDQGQTWTDFQINEDADPNELINSTQRSIIISSIAGEQDSVLIRFDWGGGEQTATNYFWMLDDVSIIETPANSSALSDAFVSLPSTLFGATSYSRVPLTQAQIPGFFFGGNIVNEGVNNLANARIVGEVTASNFSNQSITVTLPSTMDTTLFTENGFIPTVTGDYIGNIFGTDDNNTTTDTTQISFAVTEFDYARDLSDLITNGMFGSRTVNEGGGSAQLGNSFDIFNSQIIYGIRAYIDTSTDPNATAIANIYLLDNLGNFLFEAQSEVINVGQSRGDWATFVLTNPYPANEGSILASILVNGSDPMVTLGSSGMGNPGDSYLQDIDGTQQIQGGPGEWYTLPNIPMVRLSFDPSLGEVVNPVSVNEVFLSEFSVYPNPNNGFFNLEIETKNSSDIVVSVSNTLGQEVYNRELSNVTQFKDAIDISHLQTGIYILQLHDNEGVIATEKLIIE